MTVFYEWDVEEVATVENEHYAEGDILEHWHQESYKGVLSRMAKPATEGFHWEAVLVRTTDVGDRSWAYMEDGKLPEFCEDAYNNPVAKVPKRFHAEVARATAKAQS